MNEADFQRSLKFVLDHEGNYSFDKNDPGGETKYGISKKSHPKLDIKNLTIEEAEEIYRREYWVPSRADAYSWPLCLAVFDVAVNSGIVRSLRMTERTFGDGFCTSNEIALAMCNHRDGHYDRLVASRPELSRYLKGWKNRVADLRKVVMDSAHQNV